MTITEYTVAEYTSRQGSRIIAALDNKGMWNVLCLTMVGHVHFFKWTHEELEFDAAGAPMELSKR